MPPRALSSAHGLRAEESGLGRQAGKEEGWGAGAEERTVSLEVAPRWAARTGGATGSTQPSWAEDEQGAGGCPRGWEEGGSAMGPLPRGDAGTRSHR